MTEKFEGQSSIDSEMENLFKTNVDDYTYHVIEETLKGLVNEAKMKHGIDIIPHVYTTEENLHRFVKAFNFKMTGKFQKDIEFVKEDIKERGFNSPEQINFENMKLISDFAKSHSNGWIQIMKDTNNDKRDYATVEAEEVMRGDVKISASLTLDETCRLFGLKYYKPDEEDGMSGMYIDINSKKELEEALDRHEQISAWLKE